MRSPKLIALTTIIAASQILPKGLNTLISAAIITVLFIKLNEEKTKNAILISQNARLEQEKNQAIESMDVIEDSKKPSKLLEESNRLERFHALVKKQEHLTLIHIENLHQKLAYYHKQTEAMPTKTLARTEKTVLACKFGNELIHLVSNDASHIQGLDARFNNNPELYRNMYVFLRCLSLREQFQGRGSLYNHLTDFIKSQTLFVNLITTDIDQLSMKDQRKYDEETLLTFITHLTEGDWYALTAGLNLGNFKQSHQTMALCQQPERVSQASMPIEPVQATLVDDGVQRFNARQTITHILPWPGAPQQNSSPTPSGFRAAVVRLFDGCSTDNRETSQHPAREPPAACKHG